ncbi:MAG TPA: carboxypeptidase-like regulatory domain-containing protein [Planctomycetota bacterium]|nr:carboxypeptidase-like regulatory domain-containing protein [Planctomycetota bacterium]
MRRAAVALAASFAAACVGSGSEVGPELAPSTSAWRSAAVIDPSGAPVSDAQVTIGGNSSFTDRRGRFRVTGNPNGVQVVRIDARRTTTAAGAIFDAMNVAIDFSSGKGVAPRPVPLPDFQAGASATIAVNQGSALAGTLVDPATGAQLDLAGAVATLPSDVTAVQATLRFVSVAPSDVPADLTVGGIVRAGAIYFAIAPDGLVFTTPPVVRVADATFGIAAAIGNGKPVAPELDRLDPVTGTWTLAGAAAVGGGFLASSDVAGGGLFAVSLDCPLARRTIVTGRVVDRDAEPLARAAVLSRDGRGEFTASDGTFSITAVCATDADDVPIPAPIWVAAPAFQAQHAIRRDQVVAVPLGTTAFGDRPLATTPAGIARMLAIYKGNALAGAIAGASGLAGNGQGLEPGVRDARRFTTIQGTEIVDVPVGTIQAAVGARISQTQAIRTFRNATIGTAGASIAIESFPATGPLKASKQEGTITVRALHEAASTPLLHAYGFLGTNPPPQQQNLAPDGILHLQPTTPGDVLTTAGCGNEVVGLGTSFDRFRRVAYSSRRSDAATVRAPVAFDLDLSPQEFAEAGRRTGSVLPAPSPASIAETRAHAAGTFEDRIAVALGAQLDPGGVLPPTAIAPTASSPSYDAFVPIGRATLAVVERDAGGAPVSAGWTAGFDAAFGSIDIAPIALATATGGAAATTFAGFSGSAAGVAASLVIETAGEEGVSLGSTAAFTFDGTALGATIPAPGAGDVARVAIVLSDAGTTGNGSTYARAAAVVSDATGTTAGAFLAIPEVVAPAPPPGEVIPLSPTGAGIAWTADPSTDETILRVSRAGAATDPNGDSVQESFVWTVALSGSASSFVFPTLPPSFHNFLVPAFFESGKDYELEIEVRDFLDYEPRIAAASSDVIDPSFFQARAVSKTKVTFRVQ